MQQVAQHILRTAPGATLSRDSAQRGNGIATDHSEFTPLAPAAIVQTLPLVRSVCTMATVCSMGSVSTTSSKAR